MERRTSTPRAGAGRRPEQHLAVAADELARWNEQLREVSPDDLAAWNRHTADAADVAASMSIAPVFEVDHPMRPVTARDRAAVGDDETEPVKIEYLIGQGADDLARLSLAAPQPTQQPAPAASAVSSPGPSAGELAARQLVLAMRASSPDSHRGWLAVLQQFRRAIDAIDDARRARDELVTAHATSARLHEALDAAKDRIGHLPDDDLDRLLYDPNGVHDGPSPAALRAMNAARHANPTGQPDITRGTAEGGFDVDPRRRPIAPGTAVDRDHRRGRGR